MSGWGRMSSEYKYVKPEHDSNVRCYIDGGFSVERYDGFVSANYEKCKLSGKYDDCYVKTFVISCGSYDGEHIDLFDMQKWFDDNRDWINSLKKECV